jgi:hypothetical protein
MREIYLDYNASTPIDPVVPKIRFCNICDEGR